MRAYCLASVAVPEEIVHCSPVLRQMLPDNVHVIVLLFRVHASAAVNVVLLLQVVWGVSDRVTVLLLEVPVMMPAHVPD